MPLRKYLKMLVNSIMNVDLYVNQNKEYRTSHMVRSAAYSKNGKYILISQNSGYMTLYSRELHKELT